MNNKLIILFILFASCLNLSSQFYTKAQLTTIHTSKLGAEGDMYLDTTNQKYYIGMSTGELARIGDTLDELIDSMKYLNDTLIVYEGNNAQKVAINAGDGGIDSVTFNNDTLKIYESNTLYAVVLPKSDAVPLWKPDSSGVIYDSLDIINYNGILYRNETQINADSAPNVDTANWTQITGLSEQSYTGWADYQDTEYTSASPFIINATKVTLPNNAGNTVDFQKPIDIVTFYNNTDSTITGRNGDGINIVIEFSARPNTNGNTRITTAIDIGGAVGEIYKRDFVLTKGNNIEHFYLSSFNAYTLGTFEANGGKVRISSTNSTDIYNIRYVITRTHKAR